MEDQKLRTPYDSINATKHLWSKELSEIRSLLKELVGEVATVRSQNRVSMKENRGPSPTPPMFRHEYASIKFGRFYGDNPEAWIFQAEHYFEFYKIAEKYKLSLASLYLDGEALEWYRWLFRNKQLADWKHFTAKVMIRFRKQHLESQRCHLPNSEQVTSMIDYQSRFENVSSGYDDFDLASATAYVYPQWSNITKSSLPQCCDEQSEGNTKANAPKVFDELSERSKNTNSIDISSKLSQLEVEDPHKVCKLTIGETTEAYFPNGLTYSISPTAEATGCDNNAKSENMNDEEEIVTINDEPIEFVIANASKPSLWIYSIVSINYCLAMFDIHKVLNDRSNQFFLGHSEKVYPQRGLGLAQCWKKMSSIPSTCNYAKITTRAPTFSQRIIMSKMLSSEKNRESEIEAVLSPISSPPHDHFNKDLQNEESIISESAKVKAANETEDQKATKRRKLSASELYETKCVCPKIGEKGKFPMSDLYELKPTDMPTFSNLEEGGTSENELKKNDYDYDLDLAIVKAIYHYFFNHGVIPYPYSKYFIDYIETAIPKLIYRGKVLEAKIDMLQNYFLTVLEMAGGYNPDIIHPLYREIFKLSFGLWG